MFKKLKAWLKKNKKIKKVLPLVVGLLILGTGLIIAVAVQQGDNFDISPSAAGEVCQGGKSRCVGVMVGQPPAGGKATDTGKVCAKNTPRSKTEGKVVCNLRQVDAVETESESSTTGEETTSETASEGESETEDPHHSSPESTEESESSGEESEAPEAAGREPHCKNVRLNATGLKSIEGDKLVAQCLVTIGDKPECVHVTPREKRFAGWASDGKTALFEMSKEEIESAKGYTCHTTTEWYNKAKGTVCCGAQSKWTGGVSGPVGAPAAGTTESLLDRLSIFGEGFTKEATPVEEKDWEEFDKPEEPTKPSAPSFWEKAQNWFSSFF